MTDIKKRGSAPTAAHPFRLAYTHIGRGPGVMTGLLIGFTSIVAPFNRLIISTSKYGC